jgi:LysM repeat protein
VKRGETLSQIASRYEMSLQELKRINEIRNVHRIREGNIILIPVKDAGAVATTEPRYRDKPDLPDKITMKKYTPPEGYEKIIYTVKRNDTLSEIADRHHVGLSKLRRWNDLRYSSMIKPGQKLVIYLPSSDAGDSKSGNTESTDQVKDGMRLVYHIVKRGDTLTSISRLYKKSISEILDWNSGLHKDRLFPGDRIAIWILSD